MQSHRVFRALVFLVLSGSPTLKAQAPARTVSTSVSGPSERVINFLHAWLKTGDGRKRFLGTTRYYMETWATAAPLPVESGQLRAEAIYLAGRSWCGTGGCTLIIVTEDSAGTVRFAGEVGLAQLPIRVLDTHNAGWPDLGVSVFGGGARPHLGLLHHDGRQYPEDTTNDLPEVPPSRQGRPLLTDEMPETRIWPASASGKLVQRCLVVERTTFGPMYSHRTCPITR